MRIVQFTYEPLRLSATKVVVYISHQHLRVTAGINNIFLAWKSDGEDAIEVSGGTFTWEDIERPVLAKYVCQSYIFKLTVFMVTCISYLAYTHVTCLCMQLYIYKPL